MRSEIRNRDKRRGMAMIAFALMSVAIVPIVGLSIDVGTLYTVKTKLSAAVDAGALIGAQTLSQGVDPSEQAANAQAIAKDYIHANFPAGYMATENLTIPDPTVDASEANTRTVVVSASVQAPLYFLHWFASNLVTVNASATAVRRDVNVVMVVDRSGSLQVSGSCGALKSSAISFVNKFAEGRDNVGLVTFASSAFPDFPIAGNFKAASPNIASMLSSMACNGATSSAMALWEGYQQLATLNQPNALNVILFFTDGQPTGITADYPIDPSSTCNIKTSILGVFNVAADGNGTGGLLKHMVGPQPLPGDILVAPNSAGCHYNANWPDSLWSGAQDIMSIPLTDYYGNRTDTGYIPISSYRSGGIDPSNAPSVAAAAINAADDAAIRIHNGVPAGGGLPGIPHVTVFALGLGTAGLPGSDAFLQRVSNDPAASNYDPTNATGLYVDAPSAADLADAFNKIASEIVRLAK